MRPRPSCCTPYTRPFPSGLAWVHSRYCKVAPNVKIQRVDTAADRQEMELAGRLERESRSKGVASRRHRARYLAPFVAHPACVAAVADEGQPCSRCAPLLHPADCACEPCRYFDEHSDREAM